MPKCIIDNIISQASPRIRFNKDGSLLAVSTNDNGIKILVNSDGLRLLRTIENLSYDASRAPEALKVADLEIFFIQLRIFKCLLHTHKSYLCAALNKHNICSCYCCWYFRTWG